MADVLLTPGALALLESCMRTFMVSGRFLRKLAFVVGFIEAHLTGGMRGLPSCQHLHQLFNSQHESLGRRGRGRYLTNQVCSHRRRLPLIITIL